MKTIFRFDPRWLLLLSSFLPLIIILLGILIIGLFSYFKVVVLITIAFLMISPNFLVFLQSYICKKSIAPESITLLKHENYLFFTLEDPATFNKLKIIPDNFGLLIYDKFKYTLFTLSDEYQIPINDLELSLRDTGNFAKGVQLTFPNSILKTNISFIIQVFYRGNNLKIAGNQIAKSKWAIDLIKSWSIKAAEQPIA